MDEVIFPALFGNEKLKSSVGRDFAARRHSHAYIFEGCEGSGRMTAALSCAAALVCKRHGDSVPCGRCVACRKVFDGYSPDVEVISLTDRKSIGVDSVRAIRENLYVTPNDGDYRIYIIDGAETLTVQAQNALLISLEEPPPFIVFILLTASAEKLIETVRSRATLIRMESFTPEKIAEFLRCNGKSAEFASKNPRRVEEIAASCGNSPGKALELVSAEIGAKKPGKRDEGFDPHSAADRLCEALLSADRAAALDVTRSIPKGSENSRAVLSLCLDALRDIMSAKCHATYEPIFYTGTKKADALARKTTLRRLSKLFSAIEEYIWLLTQNSSEIIITTLVAME